MLHCLRLEAFVPHGDMCIFAKKYLLVTVLSLAFRADQELKASFVTVRPGLATTLGHPGCMQVSSSSFGLPRQFTRAQRPEINSHSVLKPVFLMLCLQATLICGHPIR